jgi:cytoskeletal protein CcmA (bactofilin family)
MARTREPENRWTLCTACDAAIQIASVAKSVNCPHCHTRVVTEAMDVNGYVAVRRFAVANRMHITKKGIVFASVRADSLRVDGTLQGDAVSMTGIELGKGAKVRGSLRASWLQMEDGATFSGEVIIGPDEVPELQNLEGAGEPERTA